MPDEKRPYRKKLRAEAERRTRLRITDSAVELHGTLGPSRTSMSAIAERAGVRRSTLYRHFPDEESVFAACSTHWAAANPTPDLDRWAAIEDPAERLHAALGDDLYPYYRHNESMLANVTRDLDAMPVVRQTYEAFGGYLTAANERLLAGRGERGNLRRRVQAALGHALAFSTWRSLVREQGLDDAQAADLMCRLVAAAGDRSPSG